MGVGVVRSRWWRRRTESEREREREEEGKNPDNSIIIQTGKENV